jgi:hypothetical protein
MILHHTRQKTPATNWAMQAWLEKRQYFSEGVGMYTVQSARNCSAEINRRDKALSRIFINQMTFQNPCRAVPLSFYLLSTPSRAVFTALPLPLILLSCFV